MGVSENYEKRITAELIVLSFIPVAAGLVRLTNLATGSGVNPDNARFFASPFPVVIHILSAGVFCIMGAFQFNEVFRIKNPQWHRISGRWLVLCGMIAAISGLWMTQFYPLKPNLQGNLLYGFRIIFGSAMFLFILLSVAAIRKRNIRRHRAWMIRGYAIGQGAGTQALILIPWTLIAGKPELFTYEILMVLGWVINLLVAEWFIKYPRKSNIANRLLAG